MGHITHSYLWAQRCLWDQEGDLGLEETGGDEIEIREPSAELLHGVWPDAGSAL